MDIFNYNIANIQCNIQNRTEGVRTSEQYRNAVPTPNPTIHHEVSNAIRSE